MTKEQILKAEHDLLNEILSLAWEYETAEDRATVVFYACGIHDMASELLEEAKKNEVCEMR